ncbi:MAG: hypothetical protein LBG57_09030 [Treponema sp.]|nr:hypothetical protein [Treponema sp.]
MKTLNLPAAARRRKAHKPDRSAYPGLIGVSIQPAAAGGRQVDTNSGLYYT